MRKIFDLKTFFTFLSKNKFYTTIEVFGLSVSLMFVVFISIYTVQELSVDKFHTKADRIFIIGSEETPSTGAAIAYKLKERYPEIEKVCPVVSANKKSDYYNILAKVNDQNYAVNASLYLKKSDTGFFYGFPFYGESLRFKQTQSISINLSFYYTSLLIISSSISYLY